jgi:hypothetical protein
MSTGQERASPLRLGFSHYRNQTLLLLLLLLLLMLMLILVFLQTLSPLRVLVTCWHCRRQTRQESVPAYFWQHQMLQRETRLLQLLECHQRQEP